MIKNMLPTGSMIAARRGVEKLNNVSILEDWTWYESEKKLALLTRLRVESANTELIPDETDWYVFAERTYPFGLIKFYPAKVNGIDKTFPHQNYNGIGNAGIPWREGDICVRTNVHDIETYGIDFEPYDSHLRLMWHCKRAIGWLECASKGELLKPGDPFEVPHYPVKDGFYRIAFWESESTFKFWMDNDCNSGFVKLNLLDNLKNTLVVERFTSLNGDSLLEPSWGSYFKLNSSKHESGIWVMLKKMPVIDPWQAPMTWRELLISTKQNGENLLNIVRRVINQIRDGKKHFALMGFPISAKVGEPESFIFWLAIHLPVLSHGIQTLDGFRTNQLGYWKRDVHEIFSKDTPIDWKRTENWHLNDLCSRGRLSNSLTSANVTIIGCGAVGSVLMELLVRGGASKVLIVDKDYLEVGNLARHTLTLEDLNSSKSKALMHHGVKILPIANIKHVSSDFVAVKGDDIKYVHNSDIVFDCTGSDEVLHQLENFPWRGNKTFISVSIGFQAKRLYVYITNGKHFPRIEFAGKVGKWLQKDREEFGDMEIKMSGMGCWNPVFPAGADDIWLVTASAIKYIDHKLKSNLLSSCLAVFEQSYDNDVFNGIKLVAEE